MGSTMRKLDKTKPSKGMSRRTRTTHHGNPQEHDHHMKQDMRQHSTYDEENAHNLMQAMRHKLTDDYENHSELSSV